MRKKRILIIDHEPSGRQALQSILSPDDFEVLAAEDSRSGWLTFEKEQPELVILDIQLSQGQGFDLCQRIIQATRLDRVPIVVVTDFGLESDAMLRKLSALDIDFILPKPAPPKELLQTVMSLLGARPDEAAAPAPQAGTEVFEREEEPAALPRETHKDAGPPAEKPVAPAPPPPPRPAPSPVPNLRAAEIVPLQPHAGKAPACRLVLADNNPVTRQILQRAFSAEDFEITILTDGQEALSSLEKIQPAVVLLSINLPGKNGYELCDKIGRSPALRGTAVILLKEPYEKVDQQKLEGLRWDDLIQKPIKSMEWIARVKNVLAKKVLTAGE